jgi:hypothetical protein
MDGLSDVTDESFLCMWRWLNKLTKLGTVVAEKGTELAKKKKSAILSFAFMATDVYGKILLGILSGLVIYLQLLPSLTPHTTVDEQKRMQAWATLPLLLWLSSVIHTIPLHPSYPNWPAGN